MSNAHTVRYIRTSGRQTEPVCTRLKTSIHDIHIRHLKWPGGVVVTALYLRLKRSRVRISAASLSGNDPGQVVHTHVPLSPSSVIWYRSRGDDSLRLCG